MTEIWKPFPGREHSHEVSDQGRVRSIERMVYAGSRPKADGTVRMRRVARRVLPQVVSDRGYMIVRPGGGSTHTAQVHRAVCEAFNGPAPPDKPLCRHLNDQRSDNRAVNLAWGSVADNTADAFRNGRADISGLMGHWNRGRTSSASTPGNSGRPSND